MTLIAPRLDDRHFQDLVDEAKKRIPAYFDGWTDHNVSDPGVTMIELFAWMTEMITFRQNQIPERHYVKFMELLGMRLKEPLPAQTRITFWLSAPQPTVMTINAGTEVATTQTEKETPIIFSTDDTFAIHPPQLQAIFTGTEDSGKYHLQPQSRIRIKAQTADIRPFSAIPSAQNALYFAFNNNLSSHLLGFEFACEPSAAGGIIPTLPPYIWEVATDDSKNMWQSCPVDIDETDGLNKSGRMRIYLPRLVQRTLGEHKAYWVRIRPRAEHELEPEMNPYGESPIVHGVTVSSWGGTVPATQAEILGRELLGYSDGTPNQAYTLQAAPILPRQTPETLLVKLPSGEMQSWQEVPDFSKSGIDDLHFTLDGLTGELKLGPAIRDKDGTTHHYGAVPARGSALYFSGYRVGGGQDGNVLPQLVNTLKTAIPFIGRVENRLAAEGGVNAEALSDAKLRAPQLVRTRDRAVTEADYEFLAQEAWRDMGRVKCLQPRPSEAGRIAPGTVYLLVMPNVPNPTGYISRDQLRLKSTMLETLNAYLDKRRLLTVRLDIREPAYDWVATRVQVKAYDRADKSQVREAVLARLNGYLNPLTGGDDGTGWTFGRDLYVADVFACLQHIPGVQAIRQVAMYAATPGGQARGGAVEMIEVLEHGVIASGQHEVHFV